MYVFIFIVFQSVPSSCYRAHSDPIGTLAKEQNDKSRTVFLPACTTYDKSPFMIVSALCLLNLWTLFSIFVRFQIACREPQPRATVLTLIQPAPSHRTNSRTPVISRRTATARCLCRRPPLRAVTHRDRRLRRRRRRAPPRRASRALALRHMATTTAAHATRTHQREVGPLAISLDLPMSGPPRKWRATEVLYAPHGAHCTRRVQCRCTLEAPPLTIAADTWKVQRRTIYRVARATQGHTDQHTRSACREELHHHARNTDM